MPATAGLEHTLRVLTLTPNPSANAALGVGLAASNPTIQTAAARALARRKDRDAALVLLRALPGAGTAAHEAVTTHDAARRLRPAVSKALRGSDTALCKRACRYVVEARDVESLPTLVTAAARADHPYGVGLATASLQLARELARQVHAPKLSAEAPRRDPAFARSASLVALRRAVDNFGDHRRMELVEAFLLLVMRDDHVLQRVLRDPTHPCQETLYDVLRTSPSFGAMDVVVQALLDDDAPAPLRDVLVTRSDRAFVSRLMSQIGDPPALRALDGARRLDGFGWADPERAGLIAKLTGPEQATALRLAAETRIPSERVLAMAQMLMREGHERARVVAVQVAAKRPGKAARTLIERALRDQQPDVVAAAAKGLRRQGVAHSEQRLIRLLDHADQRVRGAAQQELSEFNFRAYRDLYDGMDESSRRIAGPLVARADPGCAEPLAAELAAPSAARRLKAIEMIDAMGLAERMVELLLAALKDPDAGVRAEAAGALCGVDEAQVAGALAELAEDVNATVRDVARASLRRLAQSDAPRGEAAP